MSDPDGQARTLRRLRRGWLAAFAPVIVSAIVNICSSTELITPLPPVLNSVAWTGGTGIGLLLMWISARLTWCLPAPNGGSRIGTATVSALCLLVVPLYAVGFQHFAGHLVEMKAFGWSKSAFTPARYRVLNFNKDGKPKNPYYTAWINPYGESTAIGINESDYSRLVSVDQPDRASSYCVQVREQRDGNIIRIAADLPGTGGSTKLSLCPAAAEGPSS